MRKLSLLTALAIGIALAPATTFAQKDTGKKAGDATEGALDKAGNASEKGIKEAGEGVDEGLEATGDAVGAAVEHTTRGTMKAGEATGNALEATGEAIADFFDGDKNSDGDRVSEAQRALKAKGYYGGEIDGVPGDKTVAGLREFQADNNLKVTGTINKKTAKKLGI